MIGKRRIFRMKNNRVQRVNIRHRELLAAGLHVYCNRLIVAWTDTELRAPATWIPAFKALIHNRLLLDSHYLVVPASHPVQFIRRLFLSLHPADTLLCTSQPDQLRCSLTSSLVSAFSVSRRLVSHELPGSVDAVSIAAGNVRVVLWKRARYTPPGKFDWYRSKVFCCCAPSTSLLRR